jgi:hypothetical protein
VREKEKKKEKNQLSGGMQTERAFTSTGCAGAGFDASESEGRREERACMNESRLSAGAAGDGDGGCARRSRSRSRRSLSFSFSFRARLLLRAMTASMLDTARTGAGRGGGSGASVGSVLTGVVSSAVVVVAAAGATASLVERERGACSGSGSGVAESRRRASEASGPGCSAVRYLRICSLCRARSSRDMPIVWSSVEMGDRGGSIAAGVAGRR